MALSESKEIEKVLQSGLFRDGSEYPRRLRERNNKLVFAITLLVRQEVSLANSIGAWPTIVQAAGSGSASIVQDLLDAGALPDLADYEGRTPLMAAITRWLWTYKPEEFRLVMQLLLQNGANVNAVDKLGHTPLSLAITQDLPAASELLIAHGADVHAPLAKGYSYLSLAIAFGREEAAALLLENGVNVDAKDSCGRSALSQAILGRNDPGMNFLIENGANVYAHDKEGHSMLALAILSRNHYATARLISHGVDVEEKDTCGNTALCLAASSYDEADLKKAPDPNAFSDAMKVIICLIKDGQANQNAKNSQGHVPEEIARCAGNKDIASLIALHSRRPQWIEEGGV
ncbi:hypothetical protein KC315_g11565 [Hortaea werneckii]|nr:hypothetical protein KC315_g11565 [Hortaea werneckii]KAI7536206.1 hypothetical protein KC331_g11606 [Hortaea werneckii]KAI7720287.1 hypothetical protein KC353_g2309 [Hortaea werneckii]